MENDPMFYLCLNCLTPAEEAGVCQRCGGERVGCRPGSPEDPCRRPLMDAEGRIRTRAPLWWLRKSIPGFSKYLDEG